MPKRAKPPGALQLIDEGVHFLRQAPLSVIATYYIGALPFIVGFLFFVSDMLNSAYAYRYKADAALLMVVLFVWMKTWQARFCALMWGEASGRAIPRWTWTAAVKLAWRQAVIQVYGVFLYPFGVLLPAVAVVLCLSLLLIFLGGPMLVAAIVLGPVVGGFFQAFTVFSGLDDEVSPLTRATRQTGVWFAQHMLLYFLYAIGMGLLLITVWILIGAGPFLLKSLLGIETMMSRSGWSAVLNSTVISVSLAVTYLIGDPLFRSIYVLRCFYAEARESGADLLAELKAIRLQGTRVLVLLLAGLFLLTTVAASAQDDGVAPEELRDAIRQTMKRREFTWRMPREKLPEQELREQELAAAGPLRRFLIDIREGVKNLGTSLAESIQGIFEWIGDLIRKLLPKKKPTPARTGPNLGWWEGLVGLLPQLFIVLLVVLVVVILIGIGFFIAKVVGLRRREGADMEVEVTAKPVTPDLEAEDVSADELPEDGWVRLALEQVEQGNLRLALRALYLGCLAYLGDQHLIRIAKFKSNRDYLRELRRRGHALPAVLGAFHENTRVYESAWYGMHEVTQPMLDAFRRNAERIRNDETAE